jgi:hypothetical protein
MCWCCNRLQKYDVYIRKYSIKVWQICKHHHVGGTHYVLSQSLIISVPTDIWKLSLENHFLDLDVNVIVIIDIGLKELVLQMIVYTEMRWVVIGCCGVVL